MTHQFEFFFVFVATHIVHLAQFVDLAQSQASLAQVVQLRLAIVLAQILISFRTALIYFVKDHSVFIKFQARRRRLVLLVRLFRQLWADLAVLVPVTGLRRQDQVVPTLVPWLCRFLVQLE